MKLSNHAKTRLIQRNKAASFMRKSELQALIDSAVPLTKSVKRDHGFQASYYLIESIDLVLVVNPASNLIVTVYQQ